MSTMNISLPDQMKSWVEEQSRDGRYANSSDYVRDLIRRDQQRQMAVTEIQAAVDAAIDSGPLRPMDKAATLARLSERSAT